MALDQPHQPSLDPATETPAANGAIGRKDSRRAVFRGLLFAAFAGVCVAFGIDRWARHQARTAFDAVNEALESHRESGKPTAADVHKLIGRDPDQPAEPTENIETYSWGGPTQAYTLFVAYDRAGALREVSINARPEASRAADPAEAPAADAPQ